MNPFTKPSGQANQFSQSSSGSAPNPFKKEGDQSKFGSSKYFIYFCVFLSSNIANRHSRLEITKTLGIRHLRSKIKILLQKRQSKTLRALPAKAKLIFLRKINQGRQQARKLALVLKVRIEQIRLRPLKLTKKTIKSKQHFHHELAYFKLQSYLTNRNKKTEENKEVKNDAKSVFANKNEENKDAKSIFGSNKQNAASSVFNKKKEGTLALFVAFPVFLTNLNYEIKE